MEHVERQLSDLSLAKAIELKKTHYCERLSIESFLALHAKLIGEENQESDFETRLNLIR